MSLQGKVLITGASGFIGSRLRSQLVAEGQPVVAIRRQGSPEASEGRSVVGDYGDVDGLCRIMEREQPDYILHVAGVTKGRSYEDFQRGNVRPTRSLLRALQRTGVSPRRFVHVSSLAAYGPSSPGHPLTEADPRRPIEFYGKSKLEAELVVENEAEDVPWTIVRPSGVYGPGDVDYFNLFQSAAKGWNVFFGNRNRRMSIVYVDDCVRGITQASVSENTVRRGYFLADGVTLTWEQFQARVLDVVPNRVRTINLPESFVSLGAWAGELATQIDKKPRLLNRQKAKMGAQEAWTCSSDAATRDFGFVANVPVDVGVQHTHKWYVEQGWYR